MVICDAALTTRKRTDSELVDEKTGSELVLSPLLTHLTLLFLAKTVFTITIGGGEILFPL